jgi:ribosome-associated protein
MHHDEEQELPQWSGPSRSAKKRAAKAVETVATQLLELPEATWAKVPASTEVREEIELARRTESHGARKRQMKHLAGVLRRHDGETAVIQDFLDGLHQVHRQDKEEFHLLEELRDRICDPEHSAAALVEAEGLLSGIDRAGLARLARAVHAGNDRKAYREIFRRLRAASDAAGADD